MQQTAEFLFAIGAILLLGLATDFLGKRTFLPRVTLLLLFGIAVGDEALGLIPESISSRFEIITDVALLMIGFLLGGQFMLESLRKIGRQLAWISISASLVTTLFVTSALIIVGVSLNVAILLGCIAAATAPATTVDTVLELESDTPFSRLLLAIVAIDDAWAMLLFSFGLALASLLNGGHDIATSLFDVFYEIGGAILLGGIIGLPAAYLTGRLKPGQPMQLEALGLVFICGGIAVWLNLSFLIAAIVMGATIANLANHHEYPFHEIENIERPFMVIFFVLVGASLEIDTLSQIGIVGITYLLARGIGKVVGAWLGAKASEADKLTQRWMGVALMPQAGVAIGMALLTAHRFPEYRQIILSIIISSTVIFELIGPILTRLALKHTQPNKLD